MRPRRQYLSIPTHTQHYTVVGNPLIHQAVPLSRHRSRITVTPSSSLYNSLFTRADHAYEGLHAFLRPRRRCLSIPRHTRHCTMVGHQLIHQAVPLSRHRSRITVTPGSSLYNSLFTRAEHTSERLHACTLSRHLFLSIHTQTR
jgi:hypothetical protein